MTETSAPSAQHVLLVDDEEAILRALVRQLKPLGYRLTTASCVDRALAVLEDIEQPVDLVMSDLRMPGASGMDLLIEVKRRWPDVIRILNTGFADRQAALDAVNKGEVFRIITKPWQAGEVPQAVTDAFEHFRPIRERGDLERALAEIRRTATGETGSDADLARKLLIPNLERARLDRLKSHFVAVASHELMTPLTTLRLYCDQLLETETDTDPEARHRSYQAIGRSVDRLTRIAEDLVAVLRQQEEHADGRTLRADLALAVPEVLAEVRNWCSGRQLEFHSECVQAPAPMPPAAARQLIRNLLTNAARHTPDGGSVKITTASDDHRAKLVVEDTGVGVPDEEKSAIFERFYHAGSYEHHSSGWVRFGSRGLGLGLWVARRIVEDAGGTIGVGDRPGGGAVFRVDLPAARGGTTRLVRHKESPE